MNDLPARRAPAMALGEHLISMLADPNITAEKMNILLQMQKEIMEESRREAYQAAFAAMAAEIPQVDKRGKVQLEREGRKFGGYRYARWEDMDELIRPVLFKFGFSLSFSSRIDNSQGQILVGKLMHSAGHFETSERKLIADPGPGRNNLQAEGSGLSYAKRYIAEGLLNIVRKGEDDDGIAGGLKPITPDQVKEINGLLGETGTKTDTFLKLFVTGIEQVEQIPARDFPRLKNALEEKHRSQKSKGDGRQQ